MGFAAVVISSRIQAEDIHWKQSCPACTRVGRAITMFGCKQRMVRSYRPSCTSRERHATPPTRCSNVTCCSRCEIRRPAKSRPTISFSRWVRFDRLSESARRLEMKMGKDAKRLKRRSRYRASFALTYLRSPHARISNFSLKHFGLSPK